MIAGPFHLPDGRRGQALAVSITVMAAALLWLALIAPLWDWYAGRAAWLAQQQELAARMTALVHETASQRAVANDATAQAAGLKLLLPGGTDAIAGANLQSALQVLATNAGTSLDSVELLPAQQAGNLRRIGLQVSMTATWPVIIRMLQAIDTAAPRMIVDSFSVTNDAQPGANEDPAMQASFSVAAFRAGDPP